MKKEKKQFVALRRRVIRYNKAIVCVLALFMIYALIHSVSILDCSGINYYSTTGEVTKEMLKCTNMNSGLLAFFRNHNLTICCIFLLIALILLVLQKIQLLRINRLETSELQEEKVTKVTHIIITLLLGYTGLHKFRTENRVIGNIYLVNFIIFVISWVIKNWFTATYNNYLMFYCAYEFSVLFITGIIILNIVEAIFSLASLKDDEDKIFA